MKLWLDAQLPPVLASELRLQTGLDVVHVAELGLVTAKDEAIYAAAKDADVVLLTKDADFPRLLERLGPPPRVVWITLGNSGNRELVETVLRSWARVLAHLERGESLVEIGRKA